MEKIKKQMGANFKILKNECISPHNLFTQAGLVQFGWKKKLKVDYPVDVSFMSENCGKIEFSFIKCSNASFSIDPKLVLTKKK